ncbi:HAMP domain-containing protein [Paenibacillus psychroresistens]|uniref:HAMP domain-containing protein n=1 Tax=Paenibacillus psychroresistens TaxID=1778678 RepID=A0A6B8RQK3_9BACL|nr:histidine kinase [Paenibacillus psychroresistens]QGQ97666.1 HAMP domain-containing protein [Paenibacillus psychroresistens]
MNRFLQLLGKPIYAIRSKLKYQLLLTYMFIVFLILSIVSVIFFNFFSTKTVKENNIYMGQLNKQIILNLNHAITALENTTFLLNYNNDINELSRANRKDPYSSSLQVGTNEYKSIDNYFFNLIYSVREIYGVYIYSLEGENVFSRNRLLTAHYHATVEQTTWFKEALARKGKKVLIGRHKNQFVNDGTDVISIARSITDYRDDRTLGVIVVDLNIKQIENIVNDIQIGDQGAVVILDDQNKLVYSNNESIYQKLESSSSFNHVIGANNMQAFSLGRGNEKLLITQNKSESTNWNVLTIRPYSEIISEIVPFQKDMLLLFIFCLLIAMILSFIISEQMSKRLNLLKRFMEKAENGNFDFRMEVKGVNEISKLSAGFNSMLSTIKHLVEVEYNEKLLRKETEISLLHAQINPHFLYNTLGSIKSLSIDEGGQKTSQMIQHLVLLFRYNLSRDGKKVSIREEMDHIKNYLALQQCRFEDKMSVDYWIDEETLNEDIPIFSLQPIIENAFVHGFSQKLGNYSLEIKCCYEDQFIKIYIKDNGTGMSADQIIEINKKLEERSHSAIYFFDSKIGIFNVNLRLKQFFGEKYGLRIFRNEDEGVTVEFKLVRRDIAG